MADIIYTDAERERNLLILDVCHLLGHIRCLALLGDAYIIDYVKTEAAKGDPCMACILAAVNKQAAQRARCSKHYCAPSIGNSVEAGVRAQV
jgi:hypothetical protein